MPAPRARRYACRMKLLAYAPASRTARQRPQCIPAAAFAQRIPTRKRRPFCRYVLVEDLDHLYRTGQSRQVLELRWTR